MIILLIWRYLVYVGRIKTKTPGLKGSYTGLEGASLRLIKRSSSWLNLKSRSLPRDSGMMQSAPRKFRKNVGKYRML
jgi:hypothetical protein